ncbi:FecR family protein [Larkinella insperata]|uniref:FecR family protein n=1 Tax=Larkinella insperata TaxID=332158 RepID=A0ABW3QJP7_9BACT|nr:FecR domain-containing protein [Larkinella insperata]
MKPLEYYATLEIIDLARDPDFRRWIRNPTPEQNQFWESFKAVYPHQQTTLEQARLLVIGLESTWQNVSDSAVDASFQRLLHKKRAWQPVPKRFIWRTAFYRYAAAVAVVTLAGLGGWYLDRITAPITYRTTYGQVRTISLPDGSVVTLNANSTLEMAKNWQEKGRREVRLTGEAFFDVNKKPSGQRMPFVVHTGEADVVVLGTRFNVNTRRTRTQVVLQEGRVRVDLRQQPDVLMQPGDLVEAANGQAAVRRGRVNAHRYVAWRNNLLVLDDEPLREILQRLQDQYGLTVSIPDERLLNERFTSTVPANQPDLLLRLIATTLHLQISKNENQIVLSQLNQ